MTLIDNIQSAHFNILSKKQKNCKTFIYIQEAGLFLKQFNLFYVFIHKKLNTLCYANFHEILKLTFIYTKSIKLCVTCRFIFKNRHFEKSRAICVTFINIQKSWHFALRYFSLNFWNFQRGGASWKITMYFAKIIYMQKTMHFLLRF